jgi:myosin heavy subunit
MPGFQLVQGGPPGSERQAQGDRPDPFADLSEALSATRAKLEELTKATALVVSHAGRREKLEEIKQDNERLTAELEQANGRRTELQSSVEVAEARIAQLAKTVDAARLDAARFNEEIAKLRQQNQQLSQAEARLVETAKIVESSRAEAERLRTELAAAKEQVEQAAAAAVAAERTRQAAISEAEASSRETERAREELIAARDERAHLETANAELEERIASLHTGSRSATETARNNLAAMEEKLNELNSALGLMRSEETAPTRGPPAKPKEIEDERTAAIQAPSAAVQPPAPERAEQIDTEEPTDSATTATAPADVDSGLQRFHADIQALNLLERNTGGVDLFSRIESVDSREVQVTTTAAWGTLPPIGQQTYLDSLLDSWVAAQGGDGPTVVRIVDQSGEVLVVKSWP